MSRPMLKDRLKIIYFKSLTSKARKYCSSVYARHFCFCKVSLVIEILQNSLLRSC